VRPRDPKVDDSFKDSETGCWYVYTDKGWTEATPEEATSAHLRSIARETGRRVVENIQAFDRDPATEDWRAALLGLADRKGQSTSAQLRLTQQALAASQADLTHVERQLREAEAECVSLANRLDVFVEASEWQCTELQAKHDALAVLNVELKAEAAYWRATAARHLANLDETARALATANHDNRILAAENAAALRQLNEKES
jgi:uncharacterized protein YPO0396